jgi:hypothetical protein
MVMDGIVKINIIVLGLVFANAALIFANAGDTAGALISSTATDNTAAFKTVLFMFSLLPILENREANKT